MTNKHGLYFLENPCPVYPGAVIYLLSPTSRKIMPYGFARCDGFVAQRLHEWLDQLSFPVYRIKDFRELRKEEQRRQTRFQSQYAMACFETGETLYIKKRAHA